VREVKPGADWAGSPPRIARWGASGAGQVVKWF